MDILIPEEIATPAVAKLSSAYDVQIEPLLWKDPERLRIALAQTRTVMVRNQTQLTGDLLRSAPNLVGIGRLGVGLDNIDVAAATELGITVVAPLDANATSVAELAFGLMLALARKIPQSDRSTKAGGWDRKGGMGIELAGKTLAICGLGRIGRLLARRASAFGMRLRTYDPLIRADSPLIAELGGDWCGLLDEALAGADFVSVHAPLTPETRHLFNAERFAAMKRGSYFVNTSRGGLVNETALLEALRSGHLAGAALDVREEEPPAARIGFEAFDNVILVPHIGAATVEAQTRTFETVAADMERLLRGEPAQHAVNRSEKRTRPIGRAPAT